ncbi:Flagellar biosynthetic protein fliR [Rhodospirillaceae bacterium LM-1]|nr:Flagellar biosynthetic protein fliR [Rhodospirillaceae bacterium LM-1]
MLSAYLDLSIFHFFLVFSRLGAALMLMPVLGGRYIPANARLLLALGISLAVTPVLSPMLPGMPEDFYARVLMIVAEVTIGILLGAIVDIILASLHVAGTLISFQGGFANALIIDPITQQQGSVITGLFDMVAITLILVTDMHHLFLSAVIDSYYLFLPGQLPPISDMTEVIIRQISDSFLLGAKLASPFVVFTIVLYSAMGVLSKLAPQIQVFFVMMPLQLMASLALLGVALPGIMYWFLRHFEGVFTPFLR